MFRDWENFYLLIGSGAAALIGLLFVVATLNTGRDRRTALRGASIYLTPVVFHFAVIVVLSAVAMMPGVIAPAAGGAVGGAGLVGLAVSGLVAVRIRRGDLLEPVHWSDFWYYGMLPSVLYVGLAAAAACLWAGRQGAINAVGLLLLALMLAGIRNAWDLVTWLAPGRDATGGTSPE